MTTFTVDHARLPALDDYCRSAGLVHRSGRGNTQRWDCPLAGHSHHGNLAITVDRGLWCCHGGCGGGDVLELHMRRTGLSFLDATADLGALQESGPPARQDGQRRSIERPPVSRPQPDRERAVEAESERKHDQAVAIWKTTLPIPATPVAEYLFGRAGARLPADCTDIRFAPDLQLFGFNGPAMVGRISLATDAATGIGLHCTWLRQDGGRWVRGERRYLGRKTGGVVRLWPNEAVTYGLAVAEGVETALAASHLHRSVWASLDAGNLSNFPVLAGIASLTLFADRDHSGAGQAAAATCAERWIAAGREVTIITADELGTDIADEALVWQCN